MFCNKCGKQLKDEHKFCPTCGSAVTQDNVTVIKGEGKRKAKNPLGIVCIILSVLLVFSAVGNGIQLVNKRQRSNQLAQRDDADKAQDDKGEEKEQEQEKDNNIELAINNCCFERGSYIVEREGEIFYSTTDSIIHRDKTGNESVIYSVDGYTSLYLIGDKLYFFERYMLCSINLDGSEKCELYDTKGWISWALYKDEIYFVEKIVDEDGEGEYYIKRYCERDVRRNASFCLGPVKNYSYGSPELLCMDPYNEGSVIFRVLETREETVNDEGSIEAYRNHYKIIGTDFVNTVNIDSYVEETQDYGFSPDCILADDYLYVYPSVSSQSVDEYTGKREYLIPTVIPEKDYWTFKDMMDENQWALIEQRYKKMDINNLSKNDAKNIELLLTYYPIIESEIVYILRDYTKDNVKTKLEQYFAEAGYTIKMHREYQTLDNTERVLNTYCEPFVIGCVNPISKETMFKVWIENYIQRVLGYYENDLIVYAYVDNKWGIFRITEDVMRLYQNDGGIEAELLLELDWTEYELVLGPTDLWVDIFIDEEILYYSIEQGEQVGNVKLD